MAVSNLNGVQMAEMHPIKGNPPMNVTLSQLTCLCQFLSVIGVSVMCGFERGLGARFVTVSGVGEAILVGMLKSKEIKPKEKEKKNKTGVLE